MNGKAIDGFPGYVVYPDGRVYSVRSGVFMKPSQHPVTGYVMVHLRGGKSRTPLVHRLVAKAFLPEPRPEQIQVRHLDGVRTNNAVENLAWGTRAENEADMDRHGTRLRGERHHAAKLTLAQVETIRERLKDCPQVDLAKEYGVSKNAISRIARGRLWRKEGDPIPAAQSVEERSESARKAALAGGRKRRARVRARLLAGLGLQEKR